jgi:hypothetical protein
MPEEKFCARDSSSDIRGKLRKHCARAMILAGFLILIYSIYLAKYWLKEAESSANSDIYAVEEDEWDIPDMPIPEETRVILEQRKKNGFQGLYESAAPQETVETFWRGWFLSQGFTEEKALYGDRKDIGGMHTAESCAFLRGRWRAVVNFFPSSAGKIGCGYRVILYR